MNKFKLVFILSASLLTGCAKYNPETNSYSDPLYKFNYVMFNFNYKVLDPLILRPVAVAWKAVLPTPIRSGIKGISNNLSEPASMVNSILQGKVDSAFTHLARFMLNTIFGLGGLIDVAGMADPKLKNPTRQTFGDVLGHYHVPYGPYVVVPFYGNATLRQDGGKFVDSLYPPLSWMTLKMNIARFLVDGIEARAMALDYEELLNSSDDPYNFLRNSYFQRIDFNNKSNSQIQAIQQQRENSISEFLDDIDSQ